MGDPEQHNQKQCNLPHCHNVAGGWGVLYSLLNEAQAASAASQAHLDNTTDECHQVSVTKVDGSSSIQTFDGVCPGFVNSYKLARQTPPPELL